MKEKTMKEELNKVFSLRKLELAFPYLEAAKLNDPKAFVALASLAIADDESLRLIQSGNEKLLETIKEKVYEMPSEEVAELLANFIKGSQKFSLIISGFSPEEALQAMKTQEKSLKGNLVSQ